MRFALAGTLLTFMERAYEVRMLRQRSLQEDTKENGKEI